MKKHKGKKEISNKEFFLKAKGRGPKFVEKKSRFIASAFPISSRKQAESYITRVQKEFKKASHNAWALRFREGTTLVEEVSDDGEVPGCAGKPILYVLQKKQIVDIIVFVTRFYGGIHLGPAGLIRNYSNACKDILERIGVSEDKEEF